MENTTNNDTALQDKFSFDTFRNAVLADYKIVCQSRETSLLGRKEVLTGKAKFGIFGDGKEVAQVAMAKFFRPGDFRSGYYRDQTFMFSTGIATIEQFFSQLYADPNVEHDPFSAGRQMNAHFATKMVNENGDWLPLATLKNVSSDIAPTAGQMPRGLGLAFASKAFRKIEVLQNLTELSTNGNEICFCTIGDSSTSEGHFWETINAAGVLQVPMMVSIWDDAYGISVPAAYQTTKENIGSLLQGFRTGPDGKGFRFYTCPGWDYPRLCALYLKAADACREDHMPVLFHVTELTQPQGHSTSGSHERYKSPERLQWEKENDGLVRMRSWLLEQEWADEALLDQIEAEAAAEAKEAQTRAYQAFRQSITPWYDEVNQGLQALALALSQTSSSALSSLQPLVNSLQAEREPLRRDLMQALRRSLWVAHQNNLHHHDNPVIRDASKNLLQLRSRMESMHHVFYNRGLHSLSSSSVNNQVPVSPVYSETSPELNGFEVLNQCFDYWLAKEPTFFALGEDVGKIGDVNQGFAGLQEKHGESRVTDTGIREMSIVGQGLGAAMRGLRPLVEIQYLDYLLFALQILSDDAATLQYRSAGGQKAPLIVRTRGHRLEGIWHSGSPMGMILHSLRGMLVLVPRNMVQAAGFYNTLMHCDEPALVVECLNGYRLKEKLPENLHEFRVVPGHAEILREGSDLTLVTYGSCCRIAMEAADLLQSMGISIEVVDAQSLLPFDVNGLCAQSLRKTSRLLILDEDVPGGASSYLLQQILEVQNGFPLLDWAPVTLTAQAHRPAYGSDGDYFSKPSVDDVVETVWGLMSRAEPGYYPPLPSA